MKGVLGGQDWNRCRRRAPWRRCLARQRRPGPAPGRQACSGASWWWRKRRRSCCWLRATRARRANGGVSAKRGVAADVWRQELGGSWAGAVQWCSRPQLIVCAGGLWVVERAGGARRRVCCKLRSCGASARCGSLLCTCEVGRTSASYRISTVLLRMALLLRQTPSRAWQHRAAERVTVRVEQGGRDAARRNGDGDDGRGRHRHSDGTRETAQGGRWIFVPNTGPCTTEKRVGLLSAPCTIPRPALCARHWPDWRCSRGDVSVWCVAVSRGAALSDLQVVSPQTINCHSHTGLSSCHSSKLRHQSATGLVTHCR